MIRAALITGAAKRVGKALALALAEQGYAIALHYRSSLSEARATAAQIEKHVPCALFQCNFSDVVATQRLIDEVTKRFPGLELLINSASLFKRTPFGEESLEQLEAHFQINFKTPYILTKEFSKLHKDGQRPAQVINILDTKVAQNHAPYFSYSLSKKALWDFTQMAAVALAPKVRVNALAPGTVLPPYDMTDPQEQQAYLEKRSRMIPLQYTGQPLHLVTAVNFLLDNDYLTGQCLFLDGGEHL